MLRIFGSERAKVTGGWRKLYLELNNFYSIRMICYSQTHHFNICRPVLHVSVQRTLIIHSSSSSSVICQTTGPKPLAKRFLHIVRSRASSFNSQYPLLSLRSSSNFLHLLPCLLVTSICPLIFPSITCFRKQFLRKM